MFVFDEGSNPNVDLDAMDGHVIPATKSDFQYTTSVVSAGVTSSSSAAKSSKPKKHKKKHKKKEKECRDSPLDDFVLVD